MIIKVPSKHYCELTNSFYDEISIENIQVVQCYYFTMFWKHQTSSFSFEQDAEFKDYFYRKILKEFWREKTFRR